MYHEIMLRHVVCHNYHGILLEIKHNKPSLSVQQCKRVALSIPHGEGITVSISHREGVALSIPHGDRMVLSIPHGEGVVLSIPHERVVCTIYNKRDSYNIDFIWTQQTIISC